MSAVARISPELKRIDVPDDLKVLPAWLCWRAERHEGEVKDRKVPYWASGAKRSGAQGTAEDRAKLVTFPAALAAAQRLGMTGVGFAPMPEFGITILDFDKCVGPDGQLPPEVASITSRTFSEYSPSGAGVHAVLRGNLGDLRSQATADDYGLDTFSTKAFITFTGQLLPHIDLLGLENTIAPVTPEVQAFVQKRFGRARGTAPTDDFALGYEPKIGLTEEAAADLVNELDPDMGRQPWIVVGLALHHEASGDEWGFDIWNKWSSNGFSYPGEDNLRYQYERFSGPTPGRRSVTMASVIKMAKEARAADNRNVTVDTVQAKAEAIAAAPEFDGKFKIRSAADLTLQPPLRWIIKGVLPDADLGVIFGASGSGKSFVSLDLAGAVARGVDWRGHKTRQGRVLIVAAEGGGGYGKRIQAYCQHEGISAADLDIGLIVAAPNILDADDISELVAAVVAYGGVDLLIIDTLAQVTPGANENTSEDMGRAISNAQVLGKATRSMVVLIHHAGKDLAKGARGWSGLKGAMDVEIEVSRDEETDAREIRLSKMKDEEDGLRFGFKLETVVLGMDEDGDEYRSCVITEAELKPRRDPSARRAGAIKERGPLKVKVLEAVDSFGDEQSVSITELVAATMLLVPESEDAKRDTRQQNIRRAITQLSKEAEAPLSVVGERVIFYV